MKSQLRSRRHEPSDVRNEESALVFPYVTQITPEAFASPWRALRCTLVRTSDQPPPSKAVSQQTR